LSAAVRSRHGVHDFSALSGLRVLITGAARGIGAALAGQLASHGTARPRRTRARNDGGPRATLRRGDVRRRVRCVEQQGRSRGPSVQRPRRSGDSTWSSRTRESLPAGRCARTTCARGSGVIEINLRRHVHRPGGVAASERSGGYPLNIASTAAAFRRAGMSAYCAAKAGVEALSDCLRIEMQPLGVPASRSQAGSERSARMMRCTSHPLRASLASLLLRQRRLFVARMSVASARGLLAHRKAA
jgi:NAD(P)-dependent dehydrogenase (short-subunit alcohol dehydrogenase family)